MVIRKYGAKGEYLLEVPDDLPKLLQNAGATHGQTYRALCNIEPRKWAPEPMNASTPANTSNVSREVVELAPNLYWVHTSGWTGHRDDLRDEVWVVKGFNG